MPALERTTAAERAPETLADAQAVAQAAAPGIEPQRTGPHDDVRRLSSLIEISQALSVTLDLKSGLHDALEIFVRDQNASGASVTLAQDNGELRVEASGGRRRPCTVLGRRSGGDLITRVITTGRPVALPGIGSGTVESRHPARRMRSALCVPIVVAAQTVGALSVELTHRTDRDFEQAATFCDAVGAMIAGAIASRRSVVRERCRLEAANAHLRQTLRERYDFSRIIGTSPAVRTMYEQVVRAASTDATVWIRGESGTGKQLIARAIHYNSLRARKPFVTVNCASLPDALIESELFGHECGPRGRLELADGGTVFLDQIGEIHPLTQFKLLRVLQQREFERLGGTETVRANVRIIAATRSDLDLVSARRLAAFTILVPPLRQRKADLPLLVDHLLEKISRDHGKAILQASPQVIDAFMRYHWPGNIRELENVLERAAVACDGDVLHAHHLPPTVQTADTSGELARPSLNDAVAAYERELILNAIRTTQGNRAKAARLLQTTERILNRKVKTLDIDCRPLRA